jgi:transposase-like protein
MEAKVGVEEVTLSAVVIRADGSREDLGVIAGSDLSWWQRLKRRWRRWQPSS